MKFPSLTKPQLTFWLITVIFLSITILGRLIPEGMFVDGLVYSSIARNLAIGKGTFWHLYYYSPFTDHPPLGMSLESLLFMLIGDTYFTEKIFSAIIWIITIWMMILFWKRINNNEDFKIMFWLPLLLWNTIPTVLWSYPANMLDTIMCLFDLISVYFLYIGFKNEKKVLLYVFISGIFLFLATLTKGVVGLFPIVVPVIYFIVYKKTSFKKSILYSFLLLVFISIIYLILYQFQEPKEFFNKYIHDQLIASLEGKREKIDSVFNKFQIIIYIFIQLAPIIGIGLLMFILSFVFKVNKIKILNLRKDAVFFLLIGLSASLPLIISVKQATFYLPPSMPYYSFAMALLICPIVINLIDKYKIASINLKKLNASLLVLLICTFIYLATRIGTVDRDKTTIHDVKEFCKVIPKNEQIFFGPEMGYSWTLVAYLQRYDQLIIKEDMNVKYVITDKNKCSADFQNKLKLSNFVKINLPTIEYSVYEKMDK